MLANTGALTIDVVSGGNGRTTWLGYKQDPVHPMGNKQLAPHRCCWFGVDGLNIAWSMVKQFHWDFSMMHRDLAIYYERHYIGSRGVVRYSGCSSVARTGCLCLLPPCPRQLSVV